MTALLPWLAAAVPLGPLLGVLALVLPFLLERPLPERLLLRVVRWIGRLHLAAAVALAAAASTLEPTSVDLGRWYGEAEYALQLVFRVDPTSAGGAAVVAAVGATVLRFAESYLHRDEGQVRFYATSLLALACLDTIALAGTLDVLFMGWELLGLCSYLLLAYHHQRQETVARALRAIFSYRFGDVGLLLALVFLHARDLEPALGHGEPLVGGLATAVGLLLLITAAAKSGLAPFSAWLARSTEGPTPSTALFYAGLSVHAGPWLLLRAWPLYESSPWARAGLIALGGLTAVSLGAHASTRSDVKGAVVMAGGAQLGLIVAEIGLGWHGLALFHGLANLGLRTWQILRAPSVLQVRGRREALIGAPLPGPRPVWTWLWLWSSEGWFEGPIRVSARRLLGLAAVLDQWSQRIEAWAIGGRDEVPR